MILFNPYTDNREKGTIATIGALGAMYLDAKYAIRYDVHMLKSVRSVLKR